MPARDLRSLLLFAASGLLCPQEFLSRFSLMTVLFFDGPKGALLAAADLGLPAYSAVRP
jgi:hypothetical protein